MLALRFGSWGWKERQKPQATVLRARRGWRSTASSNGALRERERWPWKLPLSLRVLFKGLRTPGHGLALRPCLAVISLPCLSLAAWATVDSNNKRKDHFHSYSLYSVLCMLRALLSPSAAGGTCGVPGMRHWLLECYSFCN